MHSKFPGSATSDSDLNAEKKKYIWSIALFERARAELHAAALPLRIYSCALHSIYTYSLHMCVWLWVAVHIWQLNFCIKYEAK